MSAQSRLSRRDLLQRLGAAAIAVPLLPSCGGDSPASVDAPSSQADAAPSRWASGGTAAMTGKARYPDPFTTPLANCALVVTTTAGPCTTVKELVRVDVSEGLVGVPMRLALKVVDSTCKPVAGATVHIWHTNNEGSYSGVTPNPRFCLKSDSYAQSDFFRGSQVTDNNGVVYFDTCFPGAYPGRCIHVHFEVKTARISYRVSQLYFPEDVTTEIFASHVDYQRFGQPDTTLGNDAIFARVPAAERDNHVLALSRMSDGAMLAAKTVTVI